MPLVRDGNRVRATARIGRGRAPLLSRHAREEASLKRLAVFSGDEMRCDCGTELRGSEDREPWKCASCQVEALRARLDPREIARVTPAGEFPRRHVARCADRKSGEALPRCLAVVQAAIEKAKSADSTSRWIAIDLTRDRSAQRDFEAAEHDVMRHLAELGWIMKHDIINANYHMREHYHLECIGCLKGQGEWPYEESRR